MLGKIFWGIMEIAGAILSGDVSSTETCLYCRAQKPLGAAVCRKCWNGGNNKPVGWR